MARTRAMATLVPKHTFKKLTVFNLATASGDPTIQIQLGKCQMSIPAELLALCLLTLSGRNLRVATLVCREWYWAATRVLWSTKVVPLGILLEKMPFLAEESESAMVSSSAKLVEYIY